MKKNCYELVEILLKANSLTLPEAGRLLGLTAPTAYNWRETQNIKLSHVYKLADCLGYSLGLRLDKEGETHELEITPRAIKKKEAGMHFKRLFFLDVALSVYGITKVKLAEDLGLHRQTIVTMFGTDDMETQRLDQICKLYNFNLYVTLSKDSEETHKETTEEDGPKMFVTLNNKTNVEL